MVSRNKSGLENVKNIFFLKLIRYLIYFKQILLKAYNVSGCLMGPREKEMDS